MSVPSQGRRPLAVLHIIEGSGPNPWLTGLVKRFDRGLWRPVVASLEARGQLQAEVEDAAADAVALDASRRREAPLATLRLRRLVRTHRIDIVHAHNIAPGLAATLARVLGTSVPLIYMHHQGGFFEVAPIAAWKRSAYLRLESWIDGAADVVVAPSLAVRRYLERRHVPGDKIAQIPIGFDVESLEARARRLPDDLRRELGFGERFTALAVGRLSWEKDYGTMLHAWQGVAREHPEARLVIVGDGPLRRELVALAQRLGISSSVTFAGGGREDVPALMAASDVVVHAAITESFGQVLAEALLLGRPLATTDTGIAQHFEHERHCLKVPPRDPDSLRDAVCRLVEDRGLAASLGAQGRIVARQELDIERNVAEFERLYATLA